MASIPVRDIAQALSESLIGVDIAMLFSACGKIRDWKWIWLPVSWFEVLGSAWDFDKLVQGYIIFRSPISRNLNSGHWCWSYYCYLCALCEFDHLCVSEKDLHSFSCGMMDDNYQMLSKCGLHWN